MRALFRSPAATALIGSLALGVRLAAAGTPVAAPAAADYRVAQWTTADGLPQSTVTDILFLPDGELWLATFGGLARFDGHGFRVLDMATDEGLPSNRVVSLVADGADAFLFLTQQGHLGRVVAGRSALLVSPPAGSLEALELLVDGGGRVFCRSADGRGWETDRSHPWKPVRPPPGGAMLHELALDADGVAWALWGDRLGRMLAGQEPSFALPENETALSTASGGDLWIGLPGTVARLVAGRVERQRIHPALSARVSAVESAGKDALWIAAADDEVSRLDRQADGSWHRTSLPLPRGLSVRTMRPDRQGSLWIGTAGAGLFRANRLPARRYASGAGLRDVAALARDGVGGAFVANGCSTLVHVDTGGTGQAIRLRPPGGSREPPCGISLAPAPGRDVWVRWGSSLFRVSSPGLGARSVVSTLPFEEGPIVDNPDGSVWIVSGSGGVQLRSADGGLARELRLPAPLVSASLAPDGSLWVGGDSEVFRVGPQSVDRLGAREGVPRGLVRDELVEPDGTVWIGSYGGGLSRLRAGRALRLTAAEGLPDSSISRILDDGRGRLWVSTNRGIAVFDKREADAVGEGLQRTLAPVVLGSERGVPEANFGSPAGFADGDGRLWFGTIDGAVVVDAAAFPINTTPPAVRIEEVRADDRPLALGPSVRVPPLTARIRVGYAAFAPLYPERMRFRVQVEGVDAGWVEAGSERSVDWSPPGPGVHRFLVEARNEDGIWSRAPASVVLDIRPAWWQTVAFRAGVGLLFAVTALAVVGGRIRAIERRHAAKLRALEEQRRAEERIGDLRSQLEHVSRAALAGELAASIAHEVRQPVGAIVNNAEAGRRNLSRFLQRPADLEQLFDDIVADGMRVSEVVQGLRGFLRPAGDRVSAIDLSALVRDTLPIVRRQLEDDRVRVTLSLADPLPPVEGSIVQLGQVFVNLVVNACEALASATGDRQVEVSTAAHDGRVELAVVDNGPGLSPAVADRVFEPFVTTKESGLGVGLAISRSIAERHGGSLSAETRAEGGLRMVLRLPVAPSGEARS